MKVFLLLLLEEISFWWAQWFERGYRVQVLPNVDSEPQTRQPFSTNGSASSAGITLSVRPCFHHAASRRQAFWH
jgi:hypothetical protein